MIKKVIIIINILLKIYQKTSNSFDNYDYHKNKIAQKYKLYQLLNIFLKIIKKHQNFDKFE